MALLIILVFSLNDGTTFYSVDTIDTDMIECLLLAVIKA